ncbi:MAG: hypothetical protein IPN90_08975 [Elusimicrobia bacterium]|nr:hypothetical protein [Elusimicrobiota bacterium]
MNENRLPGHGGNRAIWGRPGPPLFMIVVLFLMACGKSEPPVAVPVLPSQAVYRILAFGDSLTAGKDLEDPDIQAYPAILERLLKEAGYPVTVTNGGHSGDTTFDALARLDYSLAENPQVVLVGLGSNDTFQGKRLEDIEKNQKDKIASMPTVTVRGVSSDRTIFVYTSVRAHCKEGILGWVGKSMGRRMCVGMMLFLAGGAHAARLDPAAFVSAKEEIRRLAVERIRSSKSDYERATVAAETRLRVLHESYASNGGSAPSSLEGDLRDLRGACQKMQRLAASGREPAPDEGAREMIARKWSIYQTGIGSLQRQVLEKKREKVSESQIYWTTLRAFKALRERTEIALLFNVPPGERGLEEAMDRDEVSLLKACETTAKKTRGTSLQVVAPSEHAVASEPEAQAFYRSLDQVPDTRPLRSGAFYVPVGSRTVTMREDGARLVFRPKRGKGIAYLGQSEAEIQYGYLAVAPDTAYYFENTGSEPLELEYVGLKP